MMSKLLPAHIRASACCLMISLIAGGVGLTRTVEAVSRSSQSQTSLDLGGRKWKITEIEGAKVEIDEAIVEFDAGRKRYAAKICNGMSGGYESNGSSLKLESPIGTMMACAEPLSSTEAAFQGAVAKITRGEQSGDELTLLAGDAVIMKLNAGSGRAKIGGALEREKWAVVEIGGRKVAASDRPAFLQFDRERMTYSGFSGCNRLMGKYEVNGRAAIKLSGSAMTRMACLDDEGQKLEASMTGALTKINRHTIRNGVLRLYAGTKPLLVLKPVAGD